MISTTFSIFSSRYTIRFISIYFLSIILFLSSCESLWTLPPLEPCTGAIPCQSHATKLIFDSDSSRVFHKAVPHTLLDNRILTFIAGGTLEPQTGQRISATGGTWNDIGEGATPPNLSLFNTATSNADTKQLFMIGGLDSIPSIPNSTIDLLSINTSFASDKIDIYDGDNDWNSDTIQSPRAGHTATLLSNGQLFLIGGNGDNSNTEIYDPNNSMATFSAPLQVNRYFHTSTILEDKQIVIVGGIEYSSQLTSQKVEVYNSDNNVFQERVTPNDFLPRIGHTVDNGKEDNTIVIIGGQQGETEFHDDIWTYYPNQERGFISSDQSLPFPSAYHTTTVLSNDLLLIVGGRDSNKSHDGILLFDMVEDTLITLDCALTHARHGHTTTILNLDKLHETTILVVGGQDSNGAVLQAEEIVLNLNCIKPLE